MDRVSVAGIPIVRAGLDEATTMILSDAGARRGRVYVLVNAHSAKLRRESESYARLLTDQDRVIGLADGASVAMAARVLGYKGVGRTPGPDLLEAVCTACAREGVPVFLLGGAAGIAQALGNALAVRHPGLDVVGAVTPPFGEWSEEVDHGLVSAARQSGAGIVWMGVSAPKQEAWAYRFGEELGVPTVCVGAAFDFNTGAKPRAPEWMRRAGMEWIHRLLSEPRRMWKRYLVGNTLFVYDVLRFGHRTASG